MTTISKTFDFDAAHRLDRLPPEHKCHRLHGHTYRVEIRVRGEPVRRLGMLMDYAVIAAAWKQLHDVLDHHLLNNIEGLEIPTTEVLAAWIYDHLGGHSSGEIGGVQNFPLVGLSLSVRVYESSTTYAEVP